MKIEYINMKIELSKI